MHVSQAPLPAARLCSPSPSLTTPPRVGRTHVNTAKGRSPQGPPVSLPSAQAPSSLGLRVKCHSLGPSHLHRCTSCPQPPLSSLSLTLALPSRSLCPEGHPSVFQNPGHVMGNQRSLFKVSGYAGPPSSSVMAWPCFCCPDSTSVLA